MDQELEDLVRTSVRQALVSSPDDIASALAEFGWSELAETEEAFAHTVVFEEQGRLAADTDALDVVTRAHLAMTEPARIVWPLRAGAGREPVAAADVTVDGVALRPVNAGAAILVPLGGSLHTLNADSIDEAPLGGMAIDSAWVRVHAHGQSMASHGSWVEIERRARLAIASELVGLSERILEVAVEQATARRQFGRPIGANQAVRHRLAEAHSEFVGARAFVAAAWEDGRPDAALWAKTVAGTTHDAVAKHAIQVCGAIGLHEEHPLPRLARRGFALDALLGSALAQRGEMSRDPLSAPFPVPVGTF